MVKINFLGDIALFKIFEEKKIDPFKSINLPDSDYNIGNFEFPIPNSRDKFFFDVSDEYAVSYDFFKSLDLKKFDAFSLANNHIMDYGVEGVADVINIFNDKGVRSFGYGTKRFNLLEFNLKGISFCVISFVKNGRWSRVDEKSFGPDGYDFDEIIKIIEEKKTECDHVIIFPHWGTELVEIPDPKDIINARKFIDSGASLVVGHHPHIIQGVEKYEHGYIAYSLGSFIYVPENEVGYNKNDSAERGYSICLTSEFSKDQIIDFDLQFYKYNPQTKCPMIHDTKSVKDWFKLLTISLDESLYNRRIKQVLIKREIRSFIERFKSKPFQTMKHYLNYFKFSHLKKILK